MEMPWPKTGETHPGKGRAIKEFDLSSIARMLVPFDPPKTNHFARLHAKKFIYLLLSYPCIPAFCVLDTSQLKGWPTYF